MTRHQSRKNGRRWFGTAVLCAVLLLITLAAGTAAYTAVAAEDPGCAAMPPGLIGSAPSHFGDAVRVAVQGNYAYLVDWSGSLEVFDISNPCAPISLGSTQWTANEFSDVAVAGDFAYVANDADGLAKYDVSNPAAPTRVSAQKDGDGYANSVFYDGGAVAYIGQHYSAGTELAVYNMATFPSAPTFYSPSFAGHRDIYEVTRVGDRAYVAASDGDGNTRFQVLDVRSPTTPPILVASLDLPVKKYGDGFTIAVHGDFAYLAASDHPQHDGGLVVVNLSYDKLLLVEGKATISNAGIVPWKRPGIDVVDDTAYVMGRDGLIAFDVSDPANPVPVDTFLYPASFGQTDGGGVVIRDGLAITAVAAHPSGSPADHGGIAIYRLPDSNPLGAKNQVSLVSTTESGAQGNDDSWSPAISGDGRIVAFVSNATNLWDGAYEEFRLLVKDLAAGDYDLGSFVGGTQGEDLIKNPAISADGGFVAYESANSDEVQALSVLDRYQNKSLLISGPEAYLSAAEEYRPSISADGNYIAFESDTPLASGDTNGKRDVYVYDVKTRAIEIASVTIASGGGVTYGNGESFNPSISGDGRYIAFESKASNLVSGCANHCTYILLHDRQTGQTVAVAGGAITTGDDYFPQDPRISADGRYVAFLRFVVDGSGPGDISIAVKEWQTGAEWFIQFRNDELTSDTMGYYDPAISADGTFVAFISEYNYGVPNVFVYDHRTEQIRLVSANALGHPANGRSRRPTISADGRYVAFESIADNLVEGDTNNHWDVFVYDSLLHTVLLDNPQGIVSAGEYHSCALTPDGRADCWGAENERNDHGQAQDQPGPYTQLGTGAIHSCGLRPDGSVDCWGGNQYGQAEDHPGPFTLISVSGDRNCGLKADGSVECWGRYPNTRSAVNPGPFVQVSAAFFHTCGLRPDGSVDCWGNNQYGQAEDHPGPFTQISAGWIHTCGLRPDGSVLCWGEFPDPEEYPPGGPYTQISAGSTHVCALDLDGDADCWGSFGAPIDQSGPFSQISAGRNHNCGLKPDGSIECWGSNDDGQAENQAGPFGPYVPANVFLPALEIIPGSGWRAGIQAQNAGSAAAPIALTAYDAAGQALNCGAKDTTPGQSANFLSYTDCALPHPPLGSAQLTAEGQPLASIVMMSNSSVAGGVAGASYTGMGEDVASTTLFFPLVKHNHNGRTTVFSVQNAGNTKNEITAVFRVNGLEYSKQYKNIPPFTSVLITPADAQVPGGFGQVGSLTVTAAHPLAGAALEGAQNVPVAQNLQASTAFTPADFDSTLFCPLVRNGHTVKKLTSGVQVQNVSAAAQTVKFTYTPVGGGAPIVRSKSVSPGASATFYAPTEGIPAGSLGAVVLEGSDDIVAVVNERGDLPDGRLLQTTYACFAQHKTSQTVLIPLYKEFYKGNTTGIQIQNVSGTGQAATVTLAYRAVGPGNSSGSATFSHKTPLADGASITFWGVSALPAGSDLVATGGKPADLVGTYGSVVITADQPVVAIVNESMFAQNGSSSNQDSKNYEGFNGE